MQSTVYLTLLSFLGVGQAFAQDWQLASNKHGITVYTREFAGSEVKQFRANTEITGSLNEVLNILLDVEKYSTWYDHCKTSQLVSKTDSMLQFRIEYSMPFPFSNRDVIHEMTVVQLKEEVILTFHQVDKVLPVRDGVIRMPVSDGSWILKENGQKTFIELTYLGDPAGNVPTSVVNMFLVAGPINTLSGLRDLLMHK